MSNHSAQELSHFNQLAAGWWDPQGDMKSLHAINPLRLQFITERASLAKQRVLDIGCGGGILAEALAKAGANVTAVDMAAEVIEVAKLHQLESGVNIDYHCCQLDELLTEHSASFDVITCMEMLEHVPDPIAIMQTAKRLLKPKGQLFLSTINRNLKSFVFAILGAEYVLKLIPKGTHSYNQFIRPSELARSLQENNMQVGDTCGIVYNPLTQQFRLNPQDVSVNYLMHASL